MKGIVYKVTNIKSETNKSYIGQTIRDFDVRKYRHLYDAMNGSQLVFHRAIIKYGEDAFIWEIISEVEISDLDDFEMKYIKLFNTKVPNGYNLTDGGGGNRGYKHSDESKRKIGIGNKGKNITEESKEKMRKSHKGIKMSEERIRQNSEGHKGEKNYMNKYHYYCSDNKDYWKDFTKSERSSICRKFGRKKSDVIDFKSITITRKLKEDII